MTEYIDLSSGGGPGELTIVLDCRGCSTEARPVRRRDDPSTVVRCESCGKKHHVDSLEAK